MASFAKTKLKSARDAITKKDYEKARDLASQVLEYEPDNYNARVFLALAHLELGDTSKSEQEYGKAIDLNPDQPLAWQGITKLYEKISEWEKLVTALRKLGTLHAKSNDAIKYAECLQKIVQTSREHGTKSQVVEALTLLLPDSSFHNILSTLPAPDPTNPASSENYFVVQEAIYNPLTVLEEIISIKENEEEGTLTKEVDKRRMRLGAARPEQLRREVGLEIWTVSRLPELYNEVINDPHTSDELRRSTEGKLLRYKRRILQALPPSDPQKGAVLREVTDMANGAVVIGAKDELAWKFVIEGRDAESLDDYDVPTLRNFIILFPSDPLTSFIKAYFSYAGIPLVLSGDQDEDDGRPTNVTSSNDDDPIDAILDTFPLLTDSLLAHRIASEVHISMEDYQNAIKVAENGVSISKKMESEDGLSLPKSKRAFNVSLSVSLVHYFPPKHHVRARGLIAEVIREDPQNVQAHMCLGYIFQSNAQWTKAEEEFSQVITNSKDDILNARAQEERAWSQAQTGDIQSGIAGIKSVLEYIEGDESNGHDKARCLWRLGYCHWNLADDSRDEAYRLFIAALKADPEYAPAFTSLGIYYEEHIQPPDPVRASKCFQKAFELDARENEAARRLVSGFAEESEWDLVKIIAQRTIEGEGGISGGMESSAATARYLPTNAWAWKSMGLVDLIQKDYPSSIEALQVALRADPDDHQTWLRLGEAYHKAGRHTAAIKALHRSHELMPNDWICSYVIAQVQQELGQLDEAIELYSSILQERSDEIGIMLSLARAHLELGISEHARGFFARSESTFLSAVEDSLAVMQSGEGFRSIAWKIACDAIYWLSRFAIYEDTARVFAVIATIVSYMEIDPALREILPLQLVPEEPNFSGTDACAVAVAAYNFRLSLVPPEHPSASSGWHDLAAALLVWQTRTRNNEQKDKALKLATESIAKALRQDPGSEISWNVLGLAHFSTHSKAAQHAFIRALEIDSKNVVFWSNLGLLYLFNSDLELAQETFRRVQTLDPDYAIAWVGQAVIASASDHPESAFALLEHVITLTNPDPSADLEFARRLFSNIPSLNNRGLTSDHVYPAFVVLDRYTKQRPSDATGLHLFALVCELLDQPDAAIHHILRAIPFLEAEYEATEDTIVERHYTIANLNLGRLRLASEEYTEALSPYETVLGLLAENNTVEGLRLRTQAHLGSGLANFHLGQVENAVSDLENAIELVGDDAHMRGQLTVLLAKFLWAIGTEELRESATTQLLECINIDPQNLSAINALAGIGIVTNDASLMDAALSEILSLPLDRRAELDKSRDVDYLLRQSYLAQNDLKSAISVSHKAIFSEPDSPIGRAELAQLMIQSGNPIPAHAVLSTLATTGSTMLMSAALESFALTAVAELSGGTVAGAHSMAQKAIFMRPWEVRNWRALAYTRSTSVSAETESS